MQKTRTEASQLRNLFIQADELERVSRQLESDPEPEAATSLLENKAQARRHLRDSFKKARPLVFERMFAGLEGATAERDDMALALLLLNRRIREGDAGLCGRELLWLLYDNSYDVLAAVPRLGPKGALARAKLVVSWPDPDLESHDLLDQVYALAPEAYDRVIGSDSGSAADEGLPFSDSIDHALGLYEYAQTHQRRAAKVFIEGLWRSDYGEPEETIESLDAEIDRMKADINRRHAKASNPELFSLTSLKSDFGLSGVELLMVVQLLLQEALGGQGSIDAIDLLRLVSRSERDLLRKRALLAEDSKLIQMGIVVLDEGYADRGLTGQASLNGWVTQRLLDDPLAQKQEIEVDERIQFHKYLGDLHNSADFYRRLD
ncbi:MAG: hypothetical protein V3W41_06265 [Planctomycetota bacterium]